MCKQLSSTQDLCIFEQLYCEGNDIACGSNRVVGGNTKWSKKMIESRRSNFGSYWTFLVSAAFQTEDITYNIICSCTEDEERH